MVMGSEDCCLIGNFASQIDLLHKKPHFIEIACICLLKALFFKRRVQCASV